MAPPDDGMTSTLATNTATPVTPADTAIAQGLNQALSTVSTALNGNSTAVTAVLNAIAAAITSSIIGGTTGTTDSQLLKSKGTSGFALQPSIINVDASGNMTFVGTVSQNAAGNNFATDRTIFQSSAAGQLRQRFMATNGLGRWQEGTNNTAETGSNAGSDYFINAFSDAGTYLSTPIFIQRSTGTATIPSLNSTNVNVTNSLLLNGQPIVTQIVPTVSIFTSSATITIPQGATKCKITMVGGGGGGGATVATCTGGGGGGCGSGGGCGGSC